MRTMTTSIIRTCGTCGSLNRLVIMTAGLTPAWHIGCSKCGSQIAKPRRAIPAATAEIVQLPMPARPLNQPPAVHQGTGLAVIRHLPVRHRVAVTAARASTGVSLLAACGFALVALLPETPTPQTGGSADAAPGVALTAPEMGVPEEPAELAALEPAFVAVPGQTGAAPDAGDVTFRGTLAPDGPVAGAARAAPWRIVASAALAGRAEAYPDPMEGMMALQMAALKDPTTAAETETKLALSGAQRREVQRRLQLASHDPRGVDGIFGPGTRAAISAWQEKAGLPATGYLDGRAYARLAEETDRAYRAWASDDKARRQKDQQFASATPWPRVSGRSDGCQRLGSGKIAYGQNVRCDVRGLKERFGSLRSSVAQLLDGNTSAGPSNGIARRGPGDA